MSALETVRKLPKRKEKEPEKVARRTQGERRETMTRRLLDAARDQLVLSGYAGATTARVCERAGVSQGALFRHFPTREALMVAVAEDVGGAAPRGLRGLVPRA
jgi:AcrR family transcriptional regulator